MYRILPLLIELAILVYCLIDCAQTDPARVRNLPKLVWILLIILLPLLGGIGWLIAGRPQDGTSPRRTSSFDPPAPPKGPDDDPDFLRQMRSVDAEHERTLQQWEAELRERERRLRDGQPPTDEPPTDGG